MAIGVQPSTTSLVLSDGGGQNGTIPAATERAAGCMTAQMVRDLEALKLWRVGIETGGETGVDVITRSELMTALAPLKARAQSADLSFDLRRLQSRLDALEQSPQSLSLPAPDISAERVSLLEEAVAGLGKELMRSIENEQAMASRVAEIESRLAMIANVSKKLAEEGV